MRGQSAGEEGEDEGVEVGVQGAGGGVDAVGEGEGEGGGVDAVGEGEGEGGGGRGGHRSRRGWKDGMG